MSDIENEVVFIPISDVDLYVEWNNICGCARTDQLFTTDGIYTLKKDEKEFKRYIEKFEEYALRTLKYNS
jgi:hypothetical protein